VLILSRYLLRDFLVASGLVLAGFAFVWGAADTLLHIDELSANGASALKDVLLRSVDVVPIALPLAAAIGITWSLSRSSRFREITAIRCGGVALRRVLIPVLLTSLLIGLGLAFFEDRVLVPAHRSLSGGISVEEGEEREGPRRVEQRWWYARGDWLLSAARFDRSQLALEEVTAFLLGPNRQIVERIDARRARSTAGSRWIFEEAEVRRFTPEGVELSRVAERSLDLGLDRGELASLSEPTLMTLRSLWRGAFSRGVEASDQRAVELELHQRLGRPLVVLLLVLLAIPFALSDVERGDGFAKALLQSLGASAAFWGLWTVALLGGQSGWAPPAAAVWAVLGCCFSAGALRYRTIDS